MDQEEQQLVYLDRSSEAAASFAYLDGCSGATADIFG
jgi:hypothetical protein